MRELYPTNFISAPHAAIYSATRRNARTEYPEALCALNKPIIAPVFFRVRTRDFKADTFSERYSSEGDFGKKFTPSDAEERYHLGDTGVSVLGMYLI